MRNGETLLKHSLLEGWLDRPPRLPKPPSQKGSDASPTSFPEHFPVPETWGWEMEYIVGTLCDCLDIAKTHGCLMISTDSGALQPGPMSSFASLSRLARLCRETGSATLIRYVGRKFPSGHWNSLHSLPDSLSTEEDIRAARPAFSATPTLVAMVQACCLDDVTLGHVFDVLRLSELVENQPTVTSLEERAALVLAVIGELEFVTQQLLHFNDQKPRDGTQEKAAAESRQNSALFLRHTQLLLLDFIAETGRDRSTHMKELFSRVPFVPPRPRLCKNVLNGPVTIAVPGNLAKHAWVAHGASDGASDNTQVDERRQLYGQADARFSLEALSDTALEMSLQAGSLLSIWNRLHQLWGATRAQLVHRRRLQTAWAAQLPLSPPDNGAEAKIYWAVARSVRHMNRYTKNSSEVKCCIVPHALRFRQLIFTRVLEMLCTPVTVPTASDEATAITQIKAPAPLVELVFAAFIQEAAPIKSLNPVCTQSLWKIPWPYEAESQREAILSCSQVDKTLRERVAECLCIPDSMHFLQRMEDTSDKYVIPQVTALRSQTATPPPLVQTLPMFGKPVRLTSNPHYLQGDLITLQDLGNINHLKWTDAANNQLRRALATSSLNGFQPRGREDSINV